MLFLILFCYGVCIRRMSWWNLRRTSNERQQRLICAGYLRAFSTTKNTGPGIRLQLVSVESYGKVHFIRCHRMRFVRWHDCLFPSSVWHFPTISLLRPTKSNFTILYAGACVTQNCWRTPENVCRISINKPITSEPDWKTKPAGFYRRR